MTVTPINPLVLAYIQPDRESRNPELEFQSGSLTGSRRPAEAQDSLDLSLQGLELARAAASDGRPSPAAPGLAPEARMTPPSRSLDLWT